MRTLLILNAEAGVLVFTSLFMLKTASPDVIQELCESCAFMLTKSQSSSRIKLRVTSVFGSAHIAENSNVFKLFG